MLSFKGNIYCNEESYIISATKAGHWMKRPAFLGMRHRTEAISLIISPKMPWFHSKAFLPKYGLWINGKLCA